jgi:hypothetical protein
MDTLPSHGFTQIADELKFVMRALVHFQSEQNGHESSARAQGGGRPQLPRTGYPCALAMLLPLLPLLVAAESMRKKLC